MKRRHVSAVSGVAAAALALTLAPTTAQAVPAAPDTPEKGAARHDNLPNPLAEAQATLREDAIQQLVRGEATTKTINGNRVIEVKSKKGDKNRKGRTGGKSKYVNYPVEREEDIFTVLVDFGDKVLRATGGERRPGAQPDPRAQPQARQLHVLAAGLQPQHYKDMMFGSGESFADFYKKQSNGRFIAKGDVSDWVQVPYNEARYGSNKYGDASTYWPFIKDTATAWYDAQKAARARATSRSRSTSRSSTRSTATTTTATATSTSPTATSTTSRPSTPVRARRPVAAPRATTPSGRTAGTSTPPTRARPAPGDNKLGGAADRRHRHLDR